MTKIVINKCFGGFGLSKDVAKILREKGVKITFVGEYYPDGSGPKTSFGSEENHFLYNEDFGIKSNNLYLWRTDIRLIETIEKLGLNNSCGNYALLSIVDIPDDIEWEIDEYDGIESIHETHRSWG